MVMRNGLIMIMVFVMGSWWYGMPTDCGDSDMVMVSVSTDYLVFRSSSWHRLIHFSGVMVCMRIVVLQCITRTGCDSKLLILLGPYYDFDP